MSRAPLATVPTGAVPVPSVVQAAAGGREVTPVWRNQVGGLTFRFEPSGERQEVHFAKWSATEAGIDLRDEAERLDWARSYASVPEVVELREAEEGQLLITRGLPGTSAVDPRWIRRPRRAARALGAALRHLHENLPLDACPYRWDVETRLAELPTTERADFRAQAPTEDLVVCHGDACAPNTLLDDRGELSGHVDLGTLGVGDRWADLAVLAWSAEWNYGPGLTDLVYAGYGVSADARRADYYRRLWDAT
ncbi:phosphotransferase [Glutamicibacter sp. PS]|uniref:phosphotransferase n=1 Tax=Glutamicibacter sp. PS TaxID=3075634 RepID=UPI002843A43F|nr:phosphotransferase [Glutamicibacter sp. PS]MDR4533984.1 phosphotransferase [Glutamicibacter sp. PS]